MPTRCAGAGWRISGRSRLNPAIETFPYLSHTPASALSIQGGADLTLSSDGWNTCVKAGVLCRAPASDSAETRTTRKGRRIASLSCYPVVEVLTGLGSVGEVAFGVQQVANALQRLDDRGIGRVRLQLASQP